MVKYVNITVKIIIGTSIDLNGQFTGCKDHFICKKRLCLNGIPPSSLLKFVYKHIFLVEAFPF